MLFIVELFNFLPSSPRSLHSPLVPLLPLHSFLFCPVRNESFNPLVLQIKAIIASPT